MTLTCDIKKVLMTPFLQAMTTINFYLYDISLARVKVSQSVGNIYFCHQKLHKISKLATNMITKKSKNLENFRLSQTKKQKLIYGGFFL